MGVRWAGLSVCKAGGQFGVGALMNSEPFITVALIDFLLLPVATAPLIVERLLAETNAPSSRLLPHRPPPSSLSLFSTFFSSF